MTASSAKGGRFERLIVGYLRENGYPQADRKKAGASIDRGDVSDVPDWCLELKDQVRLSLGAWLDEAVLEQANTGTAWSALVVKRKGTTDPAEQFAVMSMGQLVRLMWLARRRS